MKIKIPILFLLFFYPLLLISQTITVPWADPQIEKTKGDFARYVQMKDGGVSLDILPEFTFFSNAGERITDFQFQSPVISPLSIEEINEIQDLSAIPADFRLTLKNGWSNGFPVTSVSIVPLRKNASNGQIEKLISFGYETTNHIVPVAEKSGGEKSANSSVLASGNWHKIGTTKDGMYKVTYENMVSWGVISGPVASASVKVYGNGGRMLPEENALPRHDDLMENSIIIEDGGTGNFGAGAYLLFYGQSPNKWIHDASNNKFTFERHLYSDTTYYFLTAQGSNGKRINSRVTNGAPANAQVTNFDDFQIIEHETYNLIQSGRIWLGRNYRFSNNWDTTLTFDNLDITAPVKARTRVAGRCVACATNFYLSINNVLVDTISPAAANPIYSAPIARLASSECQGFVSSSTVPIKLNLDPNFNTGGDNGAWMDFIEVTAKRHLIFGGQSLTFRNKDIIGQGVVEYQVSNVPGDLRILDVTDPLHPVNQQYSNNGSSVAFRLSADSLMQFIAYTPSQAMAPASFGKIVNQDIHALTEDGQVDLIIVVPEAFMPAAQELADLHIFQDGMNVHILTINQIYNEFSSGAQDITAIRDMAKMYRDKATTAGYPRYLCLLGDGSYDYKTHLNRLPYPNTNFVPAFESWDSFGRSGESYTSDDFYSLLDDFEGKTGVIVTNDSMRLDVGVGRLPVRTLEEALGVVRKIRNYAENAECMRDWRNSITLVADDMEAGWEAAFVNSSENMANQMETKYPVWNVEKIYADAYVQTNNAGQRYPEANQAINNRSNRGTLVMNYIGHGGESGWTAERILQYEDILSWNNLNNLPAFATATCTFTRFDNPEYASAGEVILLEPNKGGIALFSTSRAISVVPNFNREFLDATFTPLASGEMPRLGDIIDTAKNNSFDGGEQNILLYGDPALMLAYPKFQVITDSINGKACDNITITDTLSASQTVTISGHIEDNSGGLLNGFNGVLYTTIFDKKSTLKTLANDPGAAQFTFSAYRNIVFKGKCTVENGKWSFSFKVPLDISYTTGLGKISYYAENQTVDAHGYYTRFAIGGSEDNCYGDNEGPEINVFMNDQHFKNGGITHKYPTLHVRVKDPSGINTTGIGIGHNIFAQVDNDPNKIYVLNDYFQSDLDDFTAGTIEFRLPEQQTGFHSIKVQVWDGCNNVSEETLNYVVTNGEIALVNIYNYPNPFIYSTTIGFEHNLAEQQLNAQISIYDVAGNQVKLMEVTNTPQGFRETGITWDGTNGGGHKLGSGVYICKVRITDSKGNETYGTTKMVLIAEY